MDNVYENNPQTIGELKAAITAKIKEIPKEECVRVIDNFARRMQVRLQLRGSHLEHIWKEHKHSMQTDSDGYNFVERSSIG